MTSKEAKAKGNLQLTPEEAKAKVLEKYPKAKCAYWESVCTWAIWDMQKNHLLIVSSESEDAA